MMNNVGSLIKKSLYIFLFIGVLCFGVKKYFWSVEGITDYLDIAEWAITITVPAILLYGSFLWRYMPFEKTPRIMGEYRGKISYCYLGERGIKDTEVSIQQNLFSVKVKTKTNEITSNTITGIIVKENDEFVLYYNYITNPKSEYSEKNPIQRGTCRLTPMQANKKCGIEWVSKLNGIYWTTRKTIGDIQLTKKKI